MMPLKTETTPYKQLTREKVRPVRGTEVAFLILGTLFLLFLLNWGVLWLEKAYPYNRGYWLMAQKWERLYALPEPVEWLILGDSTGNQGIVPEVLTEQLGGTAVNLNTVGSMAALDDVWMLEAYIEEHGPPPHLLIVHTYQVWHRDIEPVFLAKMPIPWQSWENKFEPRVSLTAQEEMDAWLARYFPLYTDNVSLARLIRGWVYSQRPIFAQRYQLQADGFMRVEISPQAARVESDMQQHLKYVAFNSFELSTINQQALSQLIVLAEAHDIDVYLAFGPLYEGVVENARFQLYFQQVRAELQAFADESEQLHLLETLAVFPANQMENVDHLIFEAAKTYTGIIAAEIEEKRP
ncbi:hypothetical protein [Candidatus Leptofilum sp.]|uniref:hypothetical protein n=1 Tax=Candidatus Leptofilum sp. TaxID=3241576 RepID=UPI003B5AD6FA